MGISIHHFDISAALFDLATVAVRRRSIELRAFASINDVVACAAQRALDSEIGRDQIERALRIGVDGPIRISLVARGAWRPALRVVQERLCKNAGRRLSIKQTVAVLLQCECDRPTQLEPPNPDCQSSGGT